MNYGRLNHDPEAVALLRAQYEAHGKLSPAATVDQARDESSPTHKYFEWDDTVAGEKYRIAQARQLITSIDLKVFIIPGADPVVVDISVQNVEPVQAFQSRIGMRTSGGGYELITDIYSDESKRRDMLRTVIGELRAMKARYTSLHAELAGVWDALDDLIYEQGDDIPTVAPEEI